jgi:hypothetical protein
VEEEGASAITNLPVSVSGIYLYCGVWPIKCRPRAKTNKSNCRFWRKSTYDWLVIYLARSHSITCSNISSFRLRIKARNRFEFLGYQGYKPCACPPCGPCNPSAVPTNDEPTLDHCSAARLAIESKLGRDIYCGGL